MQTISALMQVLSKSKLSLDPPESSVSLIFRLIPPFSLELLFIKRSQSTNDKHSGQIAFPGGRVEPNESNFAACIRETYEEIGIILTESEYLGHTGLKNAYQPGLRISSLKLASHVFFVTRQIEVKPNQAEVFSHRWVDFQTFTRDLKQHKKPKFNSMKHEMYKTLINPSGIISGEFPGLLLPKSKNCNSPDFSDYHLWGLTYRKTREIVSLLPPTLRNVSSKDWVHYKLYWPHRLLNPYISFLDTYYPDSLTYNNFTL